MRVRIQDLLRRLHLLGVAENLRYHWKRWALRERNRAFIRQNSGFALPPEYLAFDAYSAPDWTFYKSSGEGTARFLWETATTYLPVRHNIESVYEWGCGPGRVVRHLPSHFGSLVEVHASDYNPETIEWCRRSLPRIRFALNELNPPLAYPDNTFDFIYSISVFTHLAEATGLAWANELHRVLKPNGILLITTSGNNSYEKEMLEQEKQKYNGHGVVIRGNYEEGKKMYLARHSPRYVKENLLRQFQILYHAPAGFPFIQQDYWIARRR